MWFMTMRETQILLRAIGIQEKKIGGSGAFFLEIISQQQFKKLYNTKQCMALFVKLNFNYL